MFDVVSYSFRARKERAYLLALNVDAHPITNVKLPVARKVDWGGNERNLVDQNSHRLKCPSLPNDSLCPPTAVLRVVGSRPRKTLWADEHDCRACGRAGENSAPADR
jgi:hypothetical protein